MDNKYGSELNIPVTISPALVDKPRRSKANLIGLIVLLAVTCVGFAITAFILMAISADASAPANEAKGLLTIMVSLVMLVVSPVTLIGLFFALVLAANLRLPYDIVTRPIADIKKYTMRLTFVGLLSIFGAAGFVLLFLVCTGTSNSAYSLFLGVSAFAFVPLAILCIIWGFVYLLRARYTNNLVRTLPNSIESNIV